jgi:hypothetical protein
LAIVVRCRGWTKSPFARRAVALALATTLDVGEHGFECWQVSVDVCSNGDTHRVVPRSRARSYPHIVRRSALTASLSGVGYATRFDQQQLYLVLGVGLVLDSFGNDEHLASR